MTPLIRSRCTAQYKFVIDYVCNINTQLVLRLASFISTGI